MDYVDGLLDSKTNLAIDKHLQTNEKSKKIVEGIIFFYQKNGKNRNELEKYLNQFQDKQQKLIEDLGFQNKNSKPIKSNIFSKTVFNIAASLLLLMVCIWAFVFYYQNTPEKIVLTHLEQVYNPPVIQRSKSSSENKNWLKASLAYQKGDYLAFLNFSKNIEKSPETQFYSALSQLYLENYTKAIPIFIEVSEGKSRFREQSLWFLSLAHFQNGNKNSCKKILHEITNSSNTFKKIEAKKLLEKL